LAPCLYIFNRGATTKPFKYIIRLTGAEKRALRKLKRQGKIEARLCDRIRIILWADRDRTTIEETATRLECGRDKVIFWRRRFLEGRAAKLPVLERLRDQPRSGRPPTFSATQRETVALATWAHYQAPAPAPAGSSSAPVAIWPRN
jgi:putative transposase